MVLDTYLQQIHNRWETTYKNVIENVPILGLPYFHWKEHEIYTYGIRRDPSLSLEYAKWIAPKLRIPQEVVRDPSIRSVFYATLDHLMERSAPLFREIDNCIAENRSLNDQELNLLAQRYGIDTIPAYHFLEFLRSLRKQSFQQTQLPLQQPQTQGQQPPKQQ